ncbi:TPA: hypothetical protein ACH3X1_008728 [Trebouxia sp. C0004]
MSMVFGGVDACTGTYTTFQVLLIRRCSAADDHQCLQHAAMSVMQTLCLHNHFATAVSLQQDMTSTCSAELRVEGQADGLSWSLGNMCAKKYLHDQLHIDQE